MAKENSEGKRPSSLPDGISSIADDEVITEIDFNSFLEESSDDSSVFAGFHDDIEQTEKNLADELDSLYDDIMSSGPATIVPKPISAIVSGGEEPQEQPAEPETSALDELWLSPDEYIEPEIPLVSLDGEQEPEEAEDEPEQEAPAFDEKNDLFSMIDSLKADTDGSTGFSDILSEIESNDRITPVNEENLKAEEIVTPAPVQEEAPAPVQEEAPAPAAPDQAQDDDDFDYESELAALLGDEPEESEQPATESEAEQAQEAPAKPGFVIEIPDDGNDYAAAAAAGYDTQPLPELTKTVGSISADESQFVPPEEPAEEKPESGEKQKTSVSEIIRKMVLAISIVTIIVSSGVLVNTYIIEPYNYKKNEDLLASRLNSGANEHSDASVDDVTVSGGSSNYPTGMLAKYAQLYDVNSDLAGWISIPSLEINLPVVKGTDNSYYLRRNIYKKRTDYGVPFFDYRISDLRNLPRNTVVYGHNMRHDDLIFGMLENYREISGFKSAPVIECNTIYGDHRWFVYAVFITNSRASDDNGYLFPYNFVDVGDAKFAEYIAEIDKRKFYTTGVSLEATDKILTLSTCCYDFDEARLVVVARLQRPGESSSVDTSKAMENQNPKYPQAWYDANKKTNPYAEDARW